MSLTDTLPALMITSLTQNKMIKQNIYSILFTSKTNAIGHIGNQSNSASITKSPTTVLPWILRVLYTIPGKSARRLKLWVISNLEGHIISGEENTREKSALYPYNFRATPQSLFLLPGNYSKSKTVSK
jgi:hypothetical protein